MQINPEISLMLVLGVVTNFVLGIAFVVRASDRALTAEKSIEALNKKLAETAAELAAYKLEAAQKFVTDDMLSQVEKRVVGAIDRLADRLDRIIETRSPRRPSHSS